METIRKPKGRAPRLPVGDRLTRSEIARVEKTSGRTVAKYLDPQNYPDAPKADPNGRYSLKQYLAHVAKHGQRTLSSPELLRLRERILALRVQAMEREERIASGRYLDANEIQPQVSMICSELTRLMQSKFEDELPPKYEGMNTIARRELNEQAVDAVIKAFKSGCMAMSGTPAAPDGEPAVHAPAAAPSA